MSAAQSFGWFLRWSGRHRRWVLTVGLIGLAAWLLGSKLIGVLAVAVALGPGMAATAWLAHRPAAYERYCAAPSRQWSWRRYVRRNWVSLCRDARLADVRKGSRRNLNGERVAADRWVTPRLISVSTSSHAVTVTMRARSGQTLDELEAGVERIASTLGAESSRSWPVGGSQLSAEFVMGDLLSAARAASRPAALLVESVALGRTQAGSEWRLPLVGRHTLTVGASGSGKGSILWGICGGLAPAVHADTARLWGIDLKHGVELSMGSSLFTGLADSPERAVEVLRKLVAVINDRGARMAGVQRQHLPSPGDPLHVLVIDELASLTAYAPAAVRKEAEALLSSVLTKGRALGVVVAAFVQDPRKEVVGMRGLFTQTIALRLRNAEETTMTLGDGLAAKAPAHRISHSAPGTGWVVLDTGAANRVRADYWPDELIRAVSAEYPARVIANVEPSTPEASDPEGATGRGNGRTRSSRARRSRGEGKAS